MSNNTVQNPPPRAANGGAGAARTAKTLTALPTLKRNIPVYEVLNEEGLELIHQASMKILEEVGIDFRDTEALASWREAGADVQGQRVRISRELLMGLVAKAPEEYTMVARNPERSVTVGNEHSIFAPMYGAPYVRDLDDERRYSTLADLGNFHRLTHMSPRLWTRRYGILSPDARPRFQKTSFRACQPDRFHHQRGRSRCIQTLWFR